MTGGAVRDLDLMFALTNFADASSEGKASKDPLAWYYYMLLALTECPYDVQKNSDSQVKISLVVAEADPARSSRPPQL